MKNHKTIIRGAFSALLLFIASSAFGAEGFVRPLVAYSSNSTDYCRSAVGCGVELGASFGHEERHEWALGIENVRYSIEGDSTSGRIEGHDDSILLLAKYRYHFGSVSERVRLFAGPCMGITRSRLDTSVRLGGLRVGVDQSFWPLVFGAEAGFALRLGARADLLAGYRYLGVGSRSVDISASSVSIDSYDSHGAFIAGGIRF